MQPSKNPFHDREVAATQAALAAARPYPQYTPPEAPESTPLVDLPAVGEAKALLARIRRANAGGGNRTLAMWCGELVEFCQRYEALEEAERRHVAEVARVAALKAVRVVSQTFTAADDVMIAVRADWPQNQIVVDGVTCSLPKPICFVPREELAAFASAIEAKRAALAGRADVVPARDRQFAVLLDNWGDLLDVLAAYDIDNAGHHVGSSEIGDFIAALRDPRACLRWAASSTSQILASALDARAREIGTQGGMNHARAMATARALWGEPAVEMPPEPATMGGAA